MLFNSIEFLVFFPIACLLYFLIPHRFRYVYLLAISYAFYAYADLTALPYLILTTIITWISGKYLYKGKKPAFLGLVLVILFLCYFKYTGYLLSLFHVNPAVGIILPVGISFYTFQSITYLMDVYRQQCEPEKNILRYALFVSFFPTIMSGPICRAKDLLPQFREEHRFETDRAKSGLMLMLWGYFLKMVIVSRLTILTDLVLPDETMKGLPVLLAVLAYSFQIYCDFAGYSYIAIGCGRVMGFDLMRNFRQPYLADSVGDFWRRWHVSLSSWFRDYLYIPLGGNRKGSLRKYLNVLVVFAVSGIWHGANVTFLIWGLLNGIYQVLGGLLKDLREWVMNLLRLKNQTILRVFRIIGTFVLITLTWVFFRAPSIQEAWAILGRIFKGPYLQALMDGSIFALGLGVKNLLFVIVALMLLIAADICCEKKNCDVDGLLLHVKWPVRWAIYYVLVLMLLFSCNLSTQEFLYMSF